VSAPPVHYPESWATLNTALAHDWLTGMRGGEKCLELIASGFPRAELYSLLHKQGAVSPIIENRRIHTSALQAIPGIAKTYRYFLPAFPLALRTLGRPDADLLISTSHCVVKSLPVRQDARHLCYCFTPMRYAWTFHDEYFGGASLKGALVKPLLASLRRWDRSTARRVDRFVAISHHVRRRIEQFYDREADVVYPPADTGFYAPDSATPREDFDLIVSALVPYKRIDLAVEAYTRSGRRLVIIGTGTEFEKLKAAAGPAISFLGWQSDESIREHYRRCRFLIFPGEEDYGIVPVEAMACGTPVIAFGRGGALETIANGVSGIFFEQQTADALAEALRAAELHPWSPAAIRAHAETFGPQPFIDGLDNAIQACLKC
jgi:glycosyltransferase involved in cell wall biosynthesis